MANMMKLGNFEKKIAKIEGFVVRIEDDGSKVRKDKQIDGGLYQYKKAAAGNLTVAQWRSNRFKLDELEGYSVVVLDGDGNEVGNNSTLENVRDTY